MFGFLFSIIELLAQQRTGIPASLSRNNREWDDFERVIWLGLWLSVRAVSAGCARGMRSV